MKTVETFLKHAGIEVPVICGAMYPCSNPELVAAASEAGGIGIIQPLSLVFVHKHEFREGLRLMKRLTGKPLGMNVIVEKSSKIYEDRMKKWVDIALEEGVRFFVTSLGNPRWVVDKAHAVGGVVYHDVTTRKWAEIAMKSDIDGLIAVNNRAGGHAGAEAAEQLIADLAPLGLPVVGAGGVGSPEEFKAMLDLGYAGAQLGTRFIATKECSAHADYKAAILKAKARDIVHTVRISGVPVAVIRTPYIDKVGTDAGFIARRLLRHPKTKHYMRMYYTVQSMFKLRSASTKGANYQDYWQAGRSVEHIDAIESAADVVRSFAAALQPAQPAA